MIFNVAGNTLSLKAYMMIELHLTSTYGSCFNVVLKFSSVQSSRISHHLLYIGSSDVPPTCISFKLMSLYDADAIAESDTLFQ